MFSAAHNPNEPHPVGKTAGVRSHARRAKAGSVERVARRVSFPVGARGAASVPETADAALLWAGLQPRAVVFGAEPVATLSAARPEFPKRQSGG